MHTSAARVVSAIKKPLLKCGCAGDVPSKHSYRRYHHSIIPNGNECDETKSNFQQLQTQIEAEIESFVRSLDAAKTFFVNL